MDVAENLSLVAQLLIDRTKALVAIQELAVDFRDCQPMDSRDAGEVYPASSVEDLLGDIRRLADDALGGDNND